MKIKEILEMSFTKPVPKIAKEHLPVGEKKAYEILRELQCEPVGTGKKGWHYIGSTPEILEKDITEFIHTAKNKSNASNSKTKTARTKTTKKTKNKTIKNNDIKNNKENGIITSENVNTETIVEVNNVLSEIHELIKGKNKDEDTRVYKGIYFDKDISHFLDNVQHGNKSELVNKILRQFLSENGLI
jgi:hypothetical protein